MVSISQILFVPVLRIIFLQVTPCNGTLSSFLRSLVSQSEAFHLVHLQRAIHWAIFSLDSDDVQIKESLYAIGENQSFQAPDVAVFLSGISFMDFPPNLR
jgi:hypothetical protein